MKHDVVVLGAGITGITTAFYLNSLGYNVAVIDRQDKAAEETSYANGGQLSASHAEPWAAPGAPLQVLKWLVNKNSPLYFKPKLDLHQWMWIAEWLSNCTRDSCDRNTSALTSLAIDSIEELQRVKKIANIKFDHLSKGIIHYYRKKDSLESAIYAADVMASRGLDIKYIDRDTIFDLEPSLARYGQDIIGGTLAPSDQSGDSYKFTQQLVEYLEQRGVKFYFNTGIIRTIGTSERVIGVNVADISDPERPFQFDILSDKVVVCLGSFSYQFVKANFNSRLAIYPAKGSSITVPVVDKINAPVISLTDDENKIVMSRLGDRLRVAGTAELAGWDSTVNVDRCKIVENHAKALFGGACDWSKVEYWSGLRPTTPSNLPYIEKLGGTHNVFLNTGHGTLGWTLSCGSAKRISQIISS